ncbi:nuclear transport factor 2 family protein [Sphingobium sp. JS3065]|uniref:nuclear transport factor 2 family protein n=1 Tax=Sphingobium sp. JS3065 TaxID=2970925 RepID=UPI0022651296|nr:nuclear transport factor 2 family protein [Sphingobium sp. JS3065]UZW57080.1 nuclear transport factor 2 family protein [Sphingobium sp. JS3065]
MVSFKEKLRRLIDRQEIMDCLTRYCRGVDRLDKDLLLSAYHADAQDDHGVFVGKAADFWDWVHEAHSIGQKRTMHTIMNHMCEIDGDVAHGETYCVYYGHNADDSFDITGCRYIDRFERRDGVWRIADRICVIEWFRDLSSRPDANPFYLEAMAEMMHNAPNRRDNHDVSYMRPLRQLREPRRLNASAPFPTES